MTLANFNSNFNWQLRVLQQAVDCCGIIPKVPPPPPCKYLWSATITTFDAPGSLGILTSLINWTNDGGLTTYYDLIIEDLGYNPPDGFYNANINPYPSIHAFAFDVFEGQKLKVWFISSTQPTGWIGTEVISSNQQEILFEGGTVCADEYWDLCCWVIGDTPFTGMGYWSVFCNIGWNINSPFNNNYGTFFQNNLQNMIDATGTVSTATVTVVGSDTFIQLTNVNKAIFDTNSFIYDGVGNQWFFTECIETYFYAKVHDPYCTGFGSLFATWTLNGLPVDFGWNTLMTAPPYGTTGNAVNYPDPLSGCGPGGFNDYYFWTLMPAGALSPPSLVGNDSNNLPVSYPMLGPISQTKCYIGTITTAPGFSAIIGINTAELNTPDGYFYVDLTSPMAATFLQSVISFFYPAPPMNVTITVEGPNQYTIKIEGVYSLGTYIELYMNDYVTVGTLNEVIC